RAELEALERLARETEASNIETMVQQLATWRTRQLNLPDDLKAARADETRSRSTLEGQQKEYGETLAKRNQVEKRSDSITQQFCKQLPSYPVEILADIQMRIEESKMSLELLQQVLGEILEPGENAYILLKNELEKRDTKARNGLSQAFVEVSSLLHE